MPEAKTIDKLGIEVSNRWSQDQKFLDPSLIKEAPFVSQQITTDITSPFINSGFDTLFQLSQRFAPWALFFAPADYHIQKMRIFTHQLIPSLGSDELLETQIQKIKDKIEIAKKDQRKKRKGGPQKKENHPWEGTREEQEEIQESNVLISFLEWVQVLDSLLSEINGRRNQYQKG